MAGTAVPIVPRDRHGPAAVTVLRYAAVTAVIVGAGCSGADAPPATPALSEVADSAGIEIVTATGTTWAGGGGWSLGPSPAVEIGRGGPDQELFRVRGAVRLSDGTIVIADGGAQQLRLFAPDGAFLRAMGGEGDGPGEFRSLVGVDAVADTLFAHDFLASRVTRFTAAGDFIDDLTLPRLNASLPSRVFLTRTGYLLLYLGPMENIGESATYFRREAIYASCARACTDLTVIDRLPGQEIVSTQRQVGENIISTMTTPLVGHQQGEAVARGRLVTGTTDRFELRVFDGNGVLERLIRQPSREVAVTDAEWARIRATEVEDRGGTPEAERGVATLAEVAPRPDTRPTFSSMIGDRDGYVWLGPYRPAPDEPAPWLVVDPAGSILGGIALPTAYRPLDIGTDYVLGLTRDELDVPLVQLYRLQR